MDDVASVARPGSEFGVLRDSVQPIILLVTGKVEIIEFGYLVVYGPPKNLIEAS